MKDRMLILAMILIFILIVFTYARYNTFQQDALQSGMESVSGRLNAVMGLIQRYDSVQVSYSSRLDRLERRLVQTELEKQQLQQKLDAMNSDLGQMRKVASAPAPSPVDLGPVAVKKKMKK